MYIKKYFYFLVILYIFHNAAIYTDGKFIVWYVRVHRSSGGDLGTTQVRRIITFFRQVESSPNTGKKKVIVFTVSNLYVEHLCTKHIGEIVNRNLI